MIAGSRTYTLGLLAVLPQIVYALIAAYVATAAPEQLDAVLEGLKWIAGSTAGGAGLGALALGLRDGLSGGITSSSEQARRAAVDVGIGKGGGYSAPAPALDPLEAAVALLRQAAAAEPTTQPSTEPT
jgi:hypothetical protein